MKKKITIFIYLLLAININAQQINFCDDFEEYQNGDPIAQTSVDWNTWGELMNGTNAPFTDDASVSNILASSGNNSLYLFSGPTQGLQDVVLPFGLGTHPPTVGIFEFSSMFYVNSNTGAYFNFQAENIPGNSWSLDVKMDLGTIVLENTGNSINYLTSVYPEGQWFELKINCDLTNNIWELFINGISQGTFMNTVNKIASLDLYPIIGHEFYIDDVCFSYTPPPLSFNCINNSCVDPGDGTGTYASLINCNDVCNTTYINEKNKVNKFIYPNPATQNIYISNLTETTILKIYDITGKLVLEASVSNNEELNISTLSKGVYQIKLEGKDWSEIRKLIKE